LNIKIFHSKLFSILFPLGITLLFTLFCINDPLFWDSINSNRVAQFYFDQHFNNLLLPREIDSGNPPFLGLYFALFKFIGAQTAYLHLAMIPFVYGFWYQIVKLCKNTFKSANGYFIFILFCLIDPTIAAQNQIVYTDVPILFLFLLGYYSINKSKYFWTFLVILFCPLISIKGLIIDIILLCYIFYKKEYLKSGLLILGLIPFLIWMIYHHQIQGYWLSPPDSMWSSQRDLVSAFQLIKNGMVFGWRLIDFGRLFAFVIGIYLWLKFKPKGIIGIPLLIISALIYLIILCPFSNPISHRYLLPIIILGYLIIAQLIENSNFKSPPTKRALTIVILITLLEGWNFVYPNHIAQGWDANLAYKNYFPLKKEVDDFLAKSHIPKREVGSAFPCLASDYLTTGLGSKVEMPYLNLEKNTYLLVGNITNDVTDQQWNQIEDKFLPIRIFRKNGIYLTLFHIKTNDLK